MNKLEVDRDGWHQASSQGYVHVVESKMKWGDDPGGALDTRIGQSQGKPLQVRVPDGPEFPPVTCLIISMGWTNAGRQYRVTGTLDSTVFELKNIVTLKQSRASAEALVRAYYYGKSEGDR